MFYQNFKIDLKESFWKNPFLISELDFLKQDFWIKKFTRRFMAAAASRDRSISGSTPLSMAFVLDLERIPISVGQPLYQIAKTYLDFIAKFYIVLKGHPEIPNRAIMFQTSVKMVFSQWEKEFAQTLGITLDAHQKSITSLVNRALSEVPILEKGVCLQQMLLKEGYCSFNDVFETRSSRVSFFAADIQSAFYSGWYRLVWIITHRHASAKDVRDFRSTIPDMRNLLATVPGNQKGFKEAASTEVIWEGHTLVSLALEASAFYSEQILPMDLLEEPPPLSPPELVPSSPRERDVASPY